MHPFRSCLSLAVAGLTIAAATAHAQEPAYFVTYDHYLEEPGNLEIARCRHHRVSQRRPRLPGAVAGARIRRARLVDDRAVLRGRHHTPRRIRIRRVAMGEPLSAAGWRAPDQPGAVPSEYENVNEASRIQKEIVGSGSLSQEPIAELRREHAHELEGKLILSVPFADGTSPRISSSKRTCRRTKGSSSATALASHARSAGSPPPPPATSARRTSSSASRRTGGLGSTKEATLTDTRHFLAPVVAWQVTSRSTLKASVGFGLSDASDR